MYCFHLVTSHHLHVACLQCIVCAPHSLQHTAPHYNTLQQVIAAFRGFSVDDVEEPATPLARELSEAG